MPTKICEHCGKEFEPFLGNAGRFCSKQCYWDKGGNINRRGYKDPRLDPVEQAIERDYWWAAGIYEGEGSCRSERWLRKDDTVSFTPSVRVNQVDPWLCQRLRILFGGSLRLRHNRRENGLGDIIKSSAEIIGTNIAPRPFEIYEWNLAGERARDFLCHIYPDLSPRRQGQVRKAFMGVESHP